MTVQLPSGKNSCKAISIGLLFAFNSAQIRCDHISTNARDLLICSHVYLGENNVKMDDSLESLYLDFKKKNHTCSLEKKYLMSNILKTFILYRLKDIPTGCQMF